MASSIARRALIPEDPPSFCIKIVTDNDLRDGKSIFLKAPNCGTWWPIGVKRSVRGGRMWLHKGWQDFANFYSLDQGYFALFTYEGEHSHFLVRLFHWNDRYGNRLPYSWRRYVFLCFCKFSFRTFIGFFLCHGHDLC
ncbi:putative transcription factor B3-Domain family [Rosa chinensis]|uniref:Putative transcription factor B3-Domain family n=1 Tax=Rosa chinensis TaxID=74649 RepID=A0A2P6P2X1_ROSCH|nr:putative transcription factor B3-Domain family [Rosa chinensis]